MYFAENLKRGVNINLDLSQPTALQLFITPKALKVQKITKVSQGEDHTELCLAKDCNISIHVEHGL